MTWEDDCDITLRGNVKTKASSFLLAASSPFFQALFERTEQKGEARKELTLDESPEAFVVVLTIICQTTLADHSGF